jgi:hypothetical protein
LCQDPTGERGMFQVMRYSPAIFAGFVLW